MAETQTPNYHWIKPDLGGDSAVWGNVLNATLDSVDSVAWSNQNAGVPIGTIMMFGGASLPTNWLWCNGAVYLDTDIPSLAPVLNKKYTGSDASHTALPYIWAGVFPVGSDFSAVPMGLRGGESTHVLANGEMPTHAHGATQAAHSHGASQPAHNHAASQDAHAHTVADGTHAHVITTGGHGHNIHTGSHSHNMGGSYGYGWGGNSGFGGLYNQTTSGRTDTAGDLGGYVDGAGNLGGSTDTRYANVGNTDNRQPNVYTGNAQPAITVDTQTPAITISPIGGSVAHNNMPPYCAVAFIIRFK
jgi:microcystin-dependent protein